MQIPQRFILQGGMYFHLRHCIIHEIVGFGERHEDTRLSLIHNV